MFGASKFQHNAFGKLDRSTPVSVCTHNIRAIPDKENRTNDNAIFKDSDVLPANNEFHALFRPVSQDFLNVVLDRQEQSAKKGRKAMNKMLKHWLDEVQMDSKIGLGKTASEKLCEKLDYGTSERMVICVKCHNEQMYQIESNNICVRCHNNPTHFGRDEVGPYRCYKFKENEANTVIVEEQEPINLNPSGYKNLEELYQKLKQDYWPADFLSFPFYGDGLPCITYERMKMDCVICVAHNVRIPLHDRELLEEHCKSSCSFDWPLKDL